VLPQSAWPRTLPEPHRSLLRSLCDGLQAIPDIVGLAAGGSFAGGRMDEHSDLDLVVVVDESAWPAILEQRRDIAATLGPLLGAFTGEHVGEPRLLIAMYGPPMIHVDLKFVPPGALRERVEDPVLLWDRGQGLAALLATSRAHYPGPDPQWIEDRFWIWIHYAATKLARGELFEVLGFLAYLRSQVLGPLALAEAGVQPTGVRRLEEHAGRRVDAIRATVARYDRRDAGRAILAAVEAYRELREVAVQRSAVEGPAVAFAQSITNQSDARPLEHELITFLLAVLIGSLVGLGSGALLGQSIGLALGTTATAATHARLVHGQPLRVLLPKIALAAPLTYLAMRGIHLVFRF
jgi:hypothetical protein